MLQLFTHIRYTTDRLNATNCLKIDEVYHFYQTIFANKLLLMIKNYIKSCQTIFYRKIPYYLCYRLNVTTAWCKKFNTGM